MGGCSIEDAPKKKLNKNDNKKDEKKNNYRRDRYKDNNEELERIKIENQKKKEEAEKLVFNKINYPELSKTVFDNKKDESINYLEKVKITREQDEGDLFLRNKNNWRGDVWIGPKFMKKDTISKEYNDYLKIASKMHHQL